MSKQKCEFNRILIMSAAARVVEGLHKKLQVYRKSISNPLTLLIEHKTTVIVEINQ